MRKKDAVGLVQGLVVLGLVAVGCTLPTVPEGGDTIVTQTTNVSTGGPTGGASPSPSPGTCGPVTEVTNGILGTNGVKNAELRPTQSLPLDTTPNKNRDEHCNAFRRVVWRITQSTEVCRLNNPEVYTPQVTAVAPGRCTIVASIENVSAPEPISITVSGTAPTLRQQLGEVWYSIVGFFE